MNLLELQFYISIFVPQGKTLWENINVNLCNESLCNPCRDNNQECVTCLSSYVSKET